MVVSRRCKRLACPQFEGGASGGLNALPCGVLRRAHRLFTLRPSFDMDTDQLSFARAASIVWLCGMAPLAASVIPLLLPALQHQFRLSPASLGALAAGDLSGACLATISAPLWLRVGGIRKSALTGLGLIILGNALTLAAHSSILLLISRLAAGIGTGAIFGSAIPLVAKASRPARLVSAIQLAQLLLGGGLLLIAGAILARQGVVPVISAMMLLGLLSVPIAMVLPVRLAPEAEQAPSLKAMVPVAPTLSGILLFFVGSAVLGGFAGKLGVEHGLPIAAIGTALAVGNFGAIPGSLLAMVTGGAGKRTPTMVGATGVLLAMFVLLLREPSIAAFGIAIFLAAVCQTVIAPLQVAALVDRDRTGRGIEGVAAMQSVGQAAGPLIGGLFMSTTRVDGAYLFAMTACLASLFAVCWSPARIRASFARLRCP